MFSKTMYTPPKAKRQKSPNNTRAMGVREGDTFLIKTTPVACVTESLQLPLPRESQARRGTLNLFLKLLALPNIPQKIHHERWKQKEAQ